MLAKNLLPLLVLPTFGTANSIISKREIDEPTFGTIAYYGQYASASYCRTNFQGKEEKVECSIKNCNDVEKANQTIVRRFDE
jgi:hypothetical protein